MAKQKQKPMKGVFSKGDYWYARIDGREVYCGKGAEGQELAKAAKAKEIAKRYENKEINAGLRVRRYELKTVTELSNWYMVLPSVQDKKRYNRKVAAAAHLLKYFGKKAVNHVEADDMEQYREYRIQQGAASGTVDIEIATLRAMYHLARKRKKISADAMPGEFIIKGDRNPRRIITDHEFESILQHAESQDFKDFMICGYESAMRLSEIRKLTVNQIKLDIQHISGEKVSYIDLGIFDTKTGARRTVPVSDRLKEILERRLVGLESEDLVFTYEGKLYHQTLLRYHLMNACKKADIPYGDKLLNKKGERIGIVFHCLRHTRTSKWVEAGYSDEIIRRATGHKDLDAYRIYVKLDPHVVMRLVKNPKLEHDKNTT